MADGRDPAPGTGFRAAFPWMEIFRCFQVALDPRKLVVAAAGIFVMSLGWYLLSAIFYYKAPDRADQEYSNGTILKEHEGRKKRLPDGAEVNFTEADAREVGDKRYAEALEKWRVMADLASPSGQPNPITGQPMPVGRFRAMPWDEYRGPNPFLFVTNVLSGSASDRGTDPSAAW